MENDLKAAIAFERKVARVIESHRKGLMDPTAELDTNELYEAVKGDGHVRGGILTVVHIRKVDARVKKKLLDEKRIAGLMEAARLDPSLDDADAEDDNEMFTSAQLSRASGDGLKEASVRQHAYFWIEAVNTNGRRMTVGGDTWHVAIRGPSQAHARVTDNNDGTYLVIWKPHCSGAYSVAISLGGESLGKSPFLVRVGTALPCAANCEVKGSALHSAVSRATQAFDIRFRDRMGQVATAVDLDVFVEPVPMRSPRNRELPLSEEEKREQEEAAAREAEAAQKSFSKKERAKKEREERERIETAKRTGNRGPTKAEDAAAREREATAAAAAEQAAAAAAAMPPADAPEAAPAPEVAAKGQARYRTIRVKVGTKPLILRASCEKDSEVVGRLLPGQMVTVIEERISTEGEIRACVALDSVGRSIDAIQTVISPCAGPLASRLAANPFLPSASAQSMPPARRLPEPRASRTPRSARGKRGGTHGARAEAKSGSGAAVGATVGSLGEGRPRRGVMAADGRRDVEQPLVLATPSAADAGGSAAPAVDATTDPGLASGEAPSKAVESAEDVGSLTGWVTLVKDSQHHNGKVKLVSSRVKLGPSSRRQYMRQWERRRNNDRELQRRKGDGKDEGERDGKATSHSKATLANLAKQMMAAISDEIADDPTGIGFGFGGVEPGVLHAHGLLHEVHKVSYAIGLAGEYFLHVRLRQQALPVPGSPFKLTVLPGTACAGRSVLPPGPVRGKVGSDNDCASQTLRTSDQVGNECIAGGANVTVACSNEQLTAEVLDNGDGTYTLRWASKYSGTFKTHVRIDGEDVQGSPTDVVLVSSTPDLVKSDLDGAGLRAAVSGGVATFRIKFVDQYLNVALPGPSFKFGLALDTEKRKLSQVEPMDFDGVWEPPGDTGVYQISYWAVHAGMSALHIWCDPEAKGERIAFPGSPFTVHVAAGEASASASRVDGWTKLLKEEKSLSTKASATADSTIIYAGDTLQIRPQIFDAYGNAAVLGEELLSVYHEDANGERSTMAVSTQTRSGQTTYDVRYEVTVAGPHLIHVLLGGQAILGSPLSFYVKPDKPEPPLCKLVPPVDPLFPDTVHTTVLETYDKFGNQCDVGGLPLSNRLQLMKQGVHDQTTLVPANHTLDFEDKKDGTYHILVSTAMPCVVRLFVNLDKNLPSNQGELPPHTFHIADPNKPAMPGGGLQRQGVVNLNIDDGSTSADSSLNASGSLRSAGSPNNSISATGSNGKGSPGKKELKNDRLRAAAGEMMLGFGIAEERRDKDAIFVAAEAFADGADTFKFDEVTASAAAAASASASPIAALFDKKPSGQGGSVKRRSSCLNAASSSGSSNVSK